MADWWGNTANAGGSWWNGGQQVSGLGPTGGAVARNTYNAKNMPFDQPGVGAENAGVNVDNLEQRFAKLYANRDNKAGGSRQAWETLTKWASPEKIEGRGGSANDLQWKLVNEALRTGKLDPRLNKNTLLRGVDFAVRENSRAQQHKPKNFFTSYLLDPLVMGGLSLIPGAGPALAMGYGGIKGGVEGGPLGALTGVLGGYGAGQFTNWMKNGLTTGFGALNNVNAFMPADIAARAGSSYLPQPWTLGAGAKTAIKGGKTVANVLRNRGRRQAGPRP